MAKKRGGAAEEGGGMFVVVIVLLLVAVVAAGVVIWRQTQAGEGQKAVPPVATGPAEGTRPGEAPAAREPLVSADRIAFGGYPRPAPGAGPEAQFTVLENKAYVVGYSEARKDPLWVMYRVWKNPEPFRGLKRPEGFQEDDRTLSKIKSSDYSYSGYDRGHMAPNSAIAWCYGAEAQLQTFLMSNVVPQTPALNEKVWEKLEQKEKVFAQKAGEVWVIDGPVFGDLNGGTTRRLKSGVSVPDSCYKIVIEDEGGKVRVFAVIMPQAVKGTELPEEFVTSVREIEKKTHLDFLWKVGDGEEEALEGKVWPVWGE